jgi:SAM-dependent methyltransferase
MVSEDCPDGSLNFPGVHKHFAWDPKSVVMRGPYTCAYFTNEHSASYVVTQERLRRAIASGGFVVPPHEGKYNFVCSAATDIYTQCGFRKLICISHLEDFTIRHLPNKYVGRAGIGGQELERQIDALLRIHASGAPQHPLVTATRLQEGLFSKSYYEPRRDDLIGLIPATAAKILSVGCGYGETEAALVQKGIGVTAIPLDGVIAGAAQSRGVEVVNGELASVLAGLKHGKFDCALMTNLLHLVADPVSLLMGVSAVMADGARLVITVPNHSYAPIMIRRLCNDHKLRHLGVYSKSGVHLTTGKIMAAWIHRAGLRLERTINVIAPRHRVAQRYGLGLFDRVLAEEIVVLAGTKRAVTCLSQPWGVQPRSRAEAAHVQDQAEIHVAR